MNNDNKSTTPDKVKTLSPEWDIPNTLKVYSSTRIGGVSDAPFDSLNIGSSVNDNPAHVQQNRERLVAAVNAPAEPHWMNQVHGRDVVFIDCYHNRTQTLEADGSFTREAGQVMCVSTADCLPVVLANASGTAVSVIHAGWRGLADGVLQSGLAHFSDEEQLHAWLGPAIGPTRFEVGMDVLDAFISRNKDTAAAFKPIGNKKFMADIYTLARLALNRHRRVVVSGGDYCTYSQAELFHSFRRDGQASGRMATLAWIT